MKEWQEGLKAQRKKSSDIVYHEGKGYEIGKGYQCCETGRVGELLDINSSKGCPFVINLSDDFGNTVITCKLINEITIKKGTITEQPVELIDGECYQGVHKGNGKLYKGVYVKSTDEIFHCKCSNPSSFYTNIQRLTLAK